MIKNLETRYGKIQAFSDDLISKFLIEYGEWAYIECEFIQHVLSKSKEQHLIFDIGAFIGTFTLGLNTLGLSNSKFVAVEMNEVSFGVLESNVKEHVVNYSLVKGAIGREHRKDSLFQFFEDKDNYGATYLQHIEDSKVSNVKTIDQYTLASLGRIHGIPSLIKMDIEGMEVEALKYSQNWIVTHKPTLWLECNESANSLKLWELLAWLGYEVYYFAFPSFNPSNFNSSQVKLFGCAYEAGLLAIKKGKDSDLSISKSFYERDCIFGKVENKQELKELMWKTPRWSKEEWLDLTKAELIALLGRAELKGDFSTFLLNNDS